MDIMLKFSDNHRTDNNSLQELQASEMISADLLYELCVGLPGKNTQTERDVTQFQSCNVHRCTTWHLADCMLIGGQ